MKFIRALALSLLVCSCALAQNAAPLPMPELQFFDGNGKPLAGGLIYTYAAGTSTLQATYTGSTAATQNPNPVVLDSAGRAAIWIGTGSYKIVAQNYAGVTQWTQDNVSSVAIATGSGLSGGLSGANGATLISYEATGSTFIRTLQTKLDDIHSVKDFGAKGDGVTDDTAAIQTGINYVLGLTNGGILYFPAGKYMISSDPGLAINKATSGLSFTARGDGPWATQLIGSITTLHTGSNILTVTGSNYPITVEDLTVAANTGGNRNIDCIRATGNGHFYRHLWLSSCQNGLGLYSITDVTVSDSYEEINDQGIQINNAAAIRIVNNATYQNLESGLFVASPFNYGVMNAGVHEAVSVSNSSFTEDGNGGDGQQAAIFADAENNLNLSNIAINSYAGTWPRIGIRVNNNAANPIGTISITGAQISHTRDIGIQVDAGKVSISGGSMNEVGYVDRTSLGESDCILSGQSVEMLTVAGMQFKDCAGNGVKAQGGSVTLAGNSFLNTSNGGTTSLVNSTIGNSTILLDPYQTYFIGTATGNSMSVPSGTGKIAIQLTNRAVPAAANITISRNEQNNYATAFSSTLTALQLATQSIDMDGIFRVPGSVLTPGMTISGTSNTPLQLTGAGVAYLSLGTPTAQNAVTWCTNCTSGSAVSSAVVSGGTVSGQTATVNACGPGGSGAWAFWNGSTWKCPF